GRSYIRGLPMCIRWLQATERLWCPTASAVRTISQCQEHSCNVCGTNGGKLMRLSAPRGVLTAAFATILATLLPTQSRAAGVVDSGIADLVTTLVPGVVNISTTQYKAIQLTQGKAVM